MVCILVFAIMLFMLFYFIFRLVVINYGNVVVKLSVLASSMKPQGKVHYFVVNALCRLLFKKRHPKNSYKHYFFSKIGVSIKFCVIFY